MEEITKAYDHNYMTPNFFGDRPWLYRSFVKALVRKAKLSPRALLLDAGCGQGFFTAIFAELGIDALGVDVSSVGIEAAKKSYVHSSARFQVGDIMQLAFNQQFDCVFTRSCSLYNTAGFSHDTAVTDQLFRYVRPGGVLIMDYYTRLSEKARAEAWRYHSVPQVKEHFAKYDNADIYFSLRIETRLLGRVAFSAGVSYVASLMSRTFGFGGEVVAFVRRDHA